MVGATGVTGATGVGGQTGPTGFPGPTWNYLALSQVVGATDRHAARPTTHPYGPADIAATIYYSLGINHKGFVYDIQNRPRPILDHGEVMKEVLS